MRLVLFGLVAWISDAIEERVPKTYRLPGGAIVKRGMTRAEVEAVLGPGVADPKNRTRKVDLLIFTHGAHVARYRRGRLRSIRPAAAP
jgi:hypothetical protein